ncbi:MAG TPA: mannosyltransferase family protein [Thermoleophilaceae bacterium]|nr:mannosyltransferase family protein [Thermoleophilaceae bacterium]
MRREATAAFAASRALVYAIALFAALWLAADDSPNAAKFDDPELTHPFGGLGDTLFSPLARWDATWYLEIARDGYEGGADTAFFPLYPLLVRTLVLPHPSEGALLVSAYVVSLACFLGALWLLARLVRLELGRPVAAATVWLVALYPASLYFGAPYSESLFLLVSVGAFYAARTDRWALAGALAAAATATRSAGIVLLVPLVLMWLESRPRRPSGAAWIALAPAGLGAYALYLAIAHGDALAFADAQEAWYREFAGPFVGVWDGAVAAWDGVRQLASGSRETVYFEPAGGDPFQVAAINVLLFAFLVAGVVAVVGAFRRLPRAYGAYALAALALPLSYPVAPQPLMSLPRFMAVLFPLFVWLALVAEARGRTLHVASAFALGLGMFTTLFASWEWIA